MATITKQREMVGERVRPLSDISADGDVKRFFNNITDLIALRK